MKIIESGELRFIVGELSKKALAELSGAFDSLDELPKDAPVEQVARWSEQAIRTVSEKVVQLAIKRVERAVNGKWVPVAQGDTVMVSSGDLLTIPEVIDDAFLESLPLSTFDDVVTATWKETPILASFLSDVETQLTTTTNSA